MGLNNGTKAESWEISQRNGKPGIFTRNGKEWFDTDKAWASQSGEYYILTGMDANANEGIAIATKARLSWWRLAWPCMRRSRKALSQNTTA